MRDIEKWLEKFRESWKSGDVDNVLNLFAEDVEYHETPFLKLEGDELRSEWEGVKEHRDIDLDFEVFTEKDGRYTVQWSLSYKQNGERRRLKGVYLIELNSENRCREFWQYCETE